MRNLEISNIKAAPPSKPFLKWAGSKRAIIQYLLDRIPCSFNNYYEPFLGSGALFFALNPSNAFLSDINEELINTYIQVQNNVGDLINKLKNMQYNKIVYEKTKLSTYNNPIDKAVRFIYLNKTCWNGLYRVNSKGEFNVPMGRYKNPVICDVNLLKKASEQLKTVNIFNSDFNIILKNAKKNDFVYLDPPYTTSHKNNGFIEYNSKLFSIEDQHSLQKIVINLTKIGCKVLMSNADHKFIRDLYKGFKITSFHRRSNIAADIKKRGFVSEVLISNY